MTTPQDTIDGFADLVARAEASAETRPRADLAGAQVQALHTTLGQLGADDGDLPAAVAEALTTIRTWIADHGGLADEIEGRVAREKVRAYAVVADDLGLDAAVCDDLIARWDAATAPKPERATARRTTSGGRSTEQGLTECPICHGQYKRIKMHYTLQHKGETPPD